MIKYDETSNSSKNLKGIRRKAKTEALKSLNAADGGAPGPEEGYYIIILNSFNIIYNIIIIPLILFLKLLFLICF